LTTLPPCWPLSATNGSAGGRSRRPIARVGLLVAESSTAIRPAVVRRPASLESKAISAVRCRVQCHSQHVHTEVDQLHFYCDRGARDLGRCSTPPGRVHADKLASFRSPLRHIPTPLGEMLDSLAARWPSPSETNRGLASDGCRVMPGGAPHRPDPWDAQHET
jgi:hypothetical protein